MEVVRGLDRPVSATALPGSPGTLAVVEQAGLVRLVEGGSAGAEPLLDLRADVRTGSRAETASEEGLLSIAFDPGFETSGRFAVAYTDRRGRLLVVEQPAGRVLLAVGKDEPRHMGGHLAFSPDGRLHASVGDDTLRYEHAQDLASGDPRGKLLRLEEDGTWSVVAFGLRNPWRFSFDRATGELWIADVGEVSWEEVNVLRAGDALPANFGWPAFEGFEARDADGALGEGEPVWPVGVYGHDSGCAVVGGHVYRGALAPSLAGRYVYGDFCTGAIWSLDPSRPEDVRHELELGTTIASFGEDEAGEL